MTPDEAIKIVESKARGRTRYEGQRPFLDEVLVNKLKKMAARWERLRESCQKHIDEFEHGCVDEYESGCRYAYQRVLRKMDSLTNDM